MATYSFPIPILNASDADDQSQGGTAVEAPPAPPKRERQKQRASKPQPAKPKNLPPYQVILLNDDDHTYGYVIEMLMRIFGYEVAKAMKLTQQVDQDGQAVVWSGHKELAELKADQVKGFGPDFYADKPVEYPLGVRVEPAPQ